MFDGRVTTEFGAGTFSQEQLVAAMVGHELTSEQRPAEAIIRSQLASRSQLAFKVDWHFRAAGPTRVSGGEHEGAPGPAPAVGGPRGQGLQLGEAT